MTNDAHVGELAALARRSIGGDAEGFRALVRATHGAVFLVASRAMRGGADVEDLVQETYAKAWQALPTLREPERVLPWLCRIARNLATDAARSRAARPTVPIDDGTERALVERLCADAPLADEVLASAQLRALVQGVVDTLPDDQRVVVLLKEVDAMTAEQIGVLLGVPTKTVESRLLRGRASLAKKIMKKQRRGWFA